MDVLEYVDVIMNTMSPIVFLDHGRFGGASVVIWAGINHAVRTGLVRVNGALDAQIYWYELLHASY